MPALATGTKAVEFKHVETRGKTTTDALRDLAEGQNATHECIHAVERKVDHLVGAVDTLTALFSKGPPAVKASMGWKEHAKFAATICAAFGGLVLMIQVFAPGIAATWDAIMKASP